jgi:hypothetical protein
MPPERDRGRRQKERPKKRKGNKGSFRQGWDPRRHRFTPSDCRVGYLVAAIRHPELREWLRMKIRCFYQARKEQHVSQEEARRGSGTDGIPF